MRMELRKIQKTSTGFSTVVGAPQTWQASGYIR